MISIDFSSLLVAILIFSYPDSWFFFWDSEIPRFRFFFKFSIFSLMDSVTQGKAYYSLIIVSTSLYIDHSFLLSYYTNTELSRAILHVLVFSIISIYLPSCCAKSQFGFLIHWLWFSASALLPHILSFTSVVTTWLAHILIFKSVATMFVSKNSYSPNALWSMVLVYFMDVTFL